MKRYPKGRRAATPYLPGEDGARFFIVDGKTLAHRLGRAYNRWQRWMRQRARRHGLAEAPFAWNYPHQAPTEWDGNLPLSRYRQAPDPDYDDRLSPELSFDLPSQTTQPLTAWPI